MAQVSWVCLKSHSWTLGMSLRDITGLSKLRATNGLNSPKELNVRPEVHIMRGI